MAKLVVLSAGMTGRAHELKVDKTTIGRVEDNTFPIAEPSVSSHHCEVLLRGNEVVVQRSQFHQRHVHQRRKDHREAVLKPGQILRLGQIEMRLEAEARGRAAAPAGKKPRRIQQPWSCQRGVSLNELEQGPRAAASTPPARAFSKKDNKTNNGFSSAHRRHRGRLLVIVMLGHVIACCSASTGRRRIAATMRAAQRFHSIGVD